MISTLNLKFGSSPSKSPMEINLSRITVFVGPNNSGKSKVLREIEEFCHHGQPDPLGVIVGGITFSPIVDLLAEISNHTLRPHEGEYIPPDRILFGKGKTRNQVSREDIARYLSDIVNNRSEFCNFYASFNTIRIDGGTRVSLIEPQKAGDLQRHPETSLQVLFQDDDKRQEVRRIIYDAFKKYFVIDPTDLGNLRIRMSDSSPADDSMERGLTNAAIEYHRTALDIKDASDGVKAFTGIITTIIAGDPRTILIDEPEAFLHPSLASSLGKEISTSVNGTAKCLFVSTHSASFLMGCIQSGAPVNIIRLTYSNRTPTARILQGERVLKLMRHHTS